MSAGESKVNVWTLTGMEFVGVGPDGATRSSRAPSSSSWWAGYLDYLGTEFEWTQETDELLFVIEGTMTLTHAGTDFVSGPGDVVLIHEGSHLTFAGTKDCRVAYANGFPNGGPDDPVTVWTKQDAESIAAAGDAIDQRIFSFASGSAGYLDLHGSDVAAETKGDEFIWVTAGRVELTAGESFHSLGVGDFAFVRSGVRLTLGGTDDATLAYYRYAPS